MATFINRCVYEGDYETDGGPIDVDFLVALLVLFDASDINAAYMKTFYATTPAQGVELDAILATRPATSKPTFLRSQWVSHVVAIIRAGTQHLIGYETSAACRVKLGLS